jgi:hypothetical protein
MAMLELLSAAEFGAAKVRPAWDAPADSVEAGDPQAAVRQHHGRQDVHPLTRWSTPADRLAAAAARIEVTWRKPRNPAEEGPPPGGQGARGQRRRKTSIELGNPSGQLANHSEPAEAGV